MALWLVIGTTYSITSTIRRKIDAGSKENLLVMKCHNALRKTHNKSQPSGSCFQAMALMLVVCWPGLGATFWRVNTQPHFPLVLLCLSSQSEHVSLWKWGSDGLAAPPCVSPFLCPKPADEPLATLPVPVRVRVVQIRIPFQQCSKTPGGTPER